MNLKPKGKGINNNNYWNWNGFKIYWTVQGEENKYPIIFLHGFGASSKHWRKNLNYFVKRNYVTYSMDLIGFGNSDQPGIREIEQLDNGVWCNQVKDFIKQVIRPKSSKKVILIGNSLGALVSLTCAVSIRDEIAAVVASPLPDQIRTNSKHIVFNTFLKNIKNKFIKLFFIFLPLFLNGFLL